MIDVRTNERKEEHMLMKRRFGIKSVHILTRLSCLCFLTGCVPVAIVALGGGTIDLATQERGFKGTMSDADIRLQINNLWFEKSTELYSHILLAVQNGYVLLTGCASTEDERLEAVRLAWRVSGVKQVFNEIQVGPPQSFGSGLEDTWISTKIRTALVVEDNVYSTNYSVTTFDGVVYLMGIAQNQEELDKVIAIAKDTRGVKNVVSHVFLKDQEPLPPSQGLSPDAVSEGENDDVSITPPQNLSGSTPGMMKIKEEKLAPPQ